MSVLAVLGLVLCAYWGLLALFTAVNLVAFPRLRPAPGDAELPPAAVIIPARDEERDLGPTLEAVLAQDYPHLQVVVVDDGSTDRTPEILAEHAGHPRLRVVQGSIEEPPPAGWLGKPWALHRGVEALEDGEREEGRKPEARAAWLLFMDADVRLAPRAVADGVHHAARRSEPPLDHLALFPHFERRGFWEEVLMPLLALTLFTFFPSAAARTSRAPELAFGSGSYNLIRRSTYEALGGHRTLSNSVVDDIRLAVEVKLSGGRTALLLGDRQVRLRMYRGLAETVEGFTKNLHSLLVRHPLLSLFNLTLGTALHLAPFLGTPLLWVTGWGTPLATGLWTASLALALGSRGAVHLRLGYPLWSALCHPLSMTLGAFLSLRSYRQARGRGTVRWRGREYRTDETSF